MLNTFRQKAVYPGLDPVYPGRGPKIHQSVGTGPHDEEGRGCSFSAFWFASLQKIQKVTILLMFKKHQLHVF